MEESVNNINIFLYIFFFFILKYQSLWSKYYILWWLWSFYGIYWQWEEIISNTAKLTPLFCHHEVDTWTKEGLKHQWSIVVILPAGRENSNPLDSPRGHHLQEVLLIQWCVELRRGHVGGDVLRRATVLEPHQQRRERCLFTSPLTVSPRQPL